MTLGSKKDNTDRRMEENDITELDDSLDDIEPVNSSSGLYEHFRVTVDKGQTPVRIDKYLFERIVNASRNRIQTAADNGYVMANGKPVKSSYKVKPLDVPSPGTCAMCLRMTRTTHK